jgi:hypothetical protein
MIERRVLGDRIIAVMCAEPETQIELPSFEQEWRQFDDSLVHVPTPAQRADRDWKLTFGLRA